MTTPLPARYKLCYGVADLGAALAFVTINFFLLFFLVNVVELRPALAGLAVLIGRVLDALTDPLMGSLSDRTRSRFGRRMPYIRIGFIPLAASFALLWLAPEGSQELKFLVATATLCVFSILYTIVQIPYMSLTPELAPEYAERTSLTSYRVAFATFASLLAAAGPPLIVAAANPAGELAGAAAGWLVMGSIFGGVMLVSYGIMAFTIRERLQAPGPPKPFSFVPEYRSAFAIYGYPQILALFVVVTLGLGIVQANLPFFLASNLAMDAGQQALIQGLLFVTAIICLPLWSRLSGAFGKRSAFSVGLAVLSMGVLFIVLTASPAAVSVSLVALTVVAGIGVGSVLLFPWAMLPDVIEFDELATGARREGLVYAIFTLGQKIAMALSAFITGQVLELVGYQEGTIIQSAQASLGVQIMVGPAAAAMFLVAAGLVWLFPISRAKHEAVQRELLERAGGAP